jgi:hypothetical protein
MQTCRSDPKSLSAASPHVQLHCTLLPPLLIASPLGHLSSPPGSPVDPISSLFSCPLCCMAAGPRRARSHGQAQGKGPRRLIMPVRMGKGPRRLIMPVRMDCMKLAHLPMWVGFSRIAVPSHIGSVQLRCKRFKGLSPLACLCPLYSLPQTIPTHGDMNCLIQLFPQRHRLHRATGSTGSTENRVSVSRYVSRCVCDGLT